MTESPYPRGAKIVVPGFILAVVIMVATFAWQRKRQDDELEGLKAAMTNAVTGDAAMQALAQSIGQMCAADAGDAMPAWCHDVVAGDR